MLKLNSISPSRIKTYDMCKFKYWLTYNRYDLTLKSNWGAAHGSLIHDILENYVNGNDSDWMRRLYEGYRGELKTLDRKGEDTIMETPLVWAKPDDYKNVKPYCDSCPMAVDGKCRISNEPLDNLTGCPKNLFSESISMIEEVIDRYEDVWPKTLKVDGKILGCEYQFKYYPIGSEVPIIGIMDLVVDHGDGVIEVIDYKSGNWTQDEEECREDIQVKIYSMVSRREFMEDVNRKGYKFDTVVLTFDYFKKNPISVSFTYDEDWRTEQYVVNKIKEIQSTSKITRIVRDDVDFTKRQHWKCKSLCDTRVCQEEWNGSFDV